ncbi:MAG: hypothetical protein A2804_00665 [Candidatus Pacebacteria bacterium RIFCSPHIGHO2_01_FULL_46_10]|nr:MAG: hypothetical protein A2804_00665 [Candidatus Pacebacteria bacterium RIFCSPHIGHO2_01_FULL_46_10]
MNPLFDRFRSISPEDWVDRKIKNEERMQGKGFLKENESGVGLPPAAVRVILEHHVDAIFTTIQCEPSTEGKRERQMATVLAELIYHGNFRKARLLLGKCPEDFDLEYAQMLLLSKYGVIEGILNIIMLSDPMRLPSKPSEMLTSSATRDYFKAYYVSQRGS